MSAAFGNRPIVVSGATGRQGGAVTRKLLSSGWHVRALTRRSNSEAARQLERLGAEVIAADLDDFASLRRALAGAYGVLGVTEFWEHGHDAEIRHGTHLIDAAVVCGVERFVFHSVGGTDRTAGLGITHFDSKRVIEEHLRASPLIWTILRPVTFFENFVSPRYRRAICNQGVLRFAFDTRRSFQMVSMRDMATLATKAFEGDERFRNLAIEVASDRFTMEEFAQALTRHLGRPVRYQFLPPFAQRLITTYVGWRNQTGLFKVGPSLVNQFRWNNSTACGGWDADLDALRLLHPGLTRLDQWVASVDWRSGL